MNDHPVHYDKQQLIAEYRRTFRFVMTVLGAFAIGILLYLFVFLTYIGHSGEKTHEQFSHDFGERIDIPYDGLKLPTAQPNETPAHE